MNDIAYCTEDNCRSINCIRNQKNITDHGVLHQWVNKEEVPECPFNQKLKYYPVMTLKEIAYELLEKYKAAEEAVIYWNGGKNDEKELAEEVARYKKMIDDLT